MSGVHNAVQTKNVISKNLVLSLVGFFVLIIGVLLTLSLPKTPEIYLGLWLSISGFITIIYALIKLVIFMID